MSVIAWDGKTLAADKRSCSGTLIRTTTKIFTVGPGYLVGYSGESDAGEELLAWFRAGRDPAAFPPSSRDTARGAYLMAVWRDGSIWKFEHTPHPIKFPPQHFAIGSGRDFALAAMHLGKTAAEAVEVACVFDSACGNGVDTLVHE